VSAPCRESYFETEILSGLLLEASFLPYLQDRCHTRLTTSGPVCTVVSGDSVEHESS
jgi:hypothetical protein